MVSKASEDLPEPESPVTTTSRSRGISTETFLRLCTRAPCTLIVVRGAGRLPLRFTAALRVGYGGGFHGTTYCRGRQRRRSGRSRACGGRRRPLDAWSAPR